MSHTGTWARVEYRGLIWGGLEDFRKPWGFLADRKDPVVPVVQNLTLPHGRTSSTQRRFHEGQAVWTLLGR